MVQKCGSPVEVSSSFHYLQGFIHPRRCRTSSANSGFPGMRKNYSTGTFWWWFFGCLREKPNFRSKMGASTGDWCLGGLWWCWCITMIIILHTKSTISKFLLTPWPPLFFALQTPTSVVEERLQTSYIRHIPAHLCLCFGLWPGVASTVTFGQEGLFHLLWAYLEKKFVASQPTPP